MRKLPKLSSLHTDHRSYPPGVAYMDGQYLPIHEAKLSVLDYGFLHSDATYDVAHVWGGAFFRLGRSFGSIFQWNERFAYVNSLQQIANHGNSS